MGLDGRDLGGENTVSVKCPFGWTGAAGGEQDGRGFIAGGLRGGKRRAANASQVLQAVLARKPAATDGDPGFDGTEEPRKQNPQDVRRGNTDEGRGAGLLETVDHPPYPHARIDNHRHGAGLEEGKGQGKKIEAGFDHQDCARSAGDSRILEAPGQVVRLLIELLKSQVGIGHTPAAVTAKGADDRFFVGLNAGHTFQERGDIENRVGRRGVDRK
jgi:hypothetical protein